MSDEEILSRVGDDKALGAWINKMHHGYSAAFKDRVIKLAEEIAAEGLKDDELNSWVSPQVQNDVGIRTIAQKLLLLRNKLEMRAYELSGTEGAGEGALSGHSATYVTLNAPDIMLHDVRHRDVVLFNQVPPSLHGPLLEQYVSSRCACKNGCRAYDILQGSTAATLAPRTIFYVPS